MSAAAVTTATAATTATTATTTAATATATITATTARLCLRLRLLRCILKLTKYFEIKNMVISRATKGLQT